ncbi:DUF2092 domain-containing protein [Candidatus Sumerlaeota bacterium]
MKRTIACLVVLGLLATSPALAADATTATYTLDKEVEQLLTSMSKFVGAQPHLQFDVLDSIDQIDEDGVRVQLSHLRKVQLTRPDKFASTVKGDRAERRSVFNQGRLTVLSPGENIYLQKDDLPKTVEQTLDHLAEKEGLSFPLADFLRQEIVDKSLLANITFAEYVGESVVEPAACHHLVFQQENIDWQLWIQEGDQPVPRKLVITYRQLPGHPQFTARFNNWQFPKAIADDVFQIEVPKTAEQVSFYSDVVKSLKEEAK